MNLAFLNMWKLFNEFKWFSYRNKLKKIKLVIFDVDGVLTDGGIYIDSNGNLQKKFDVKDGLGIKLLQHYGIELAFISGGSSGASNIRAKQLNIKYCLTGVKNKLEAVNILQKELNITPSETAFLGDDLNDLVIKKLVSILVVPSDGCKSIIENADLILSKKGGNGAVREFSERLLHRKNRFQEIYKKGWFNKND